MKKHLSTHLLGKHGVGEPKERYVEYFQLHSCVLLYSDIQTFLFVFHLNSGNLVEIISSSSTLMKITI